MDNTMPQDTLSFVQRLQEYGVLGYAWILVISLWAGTVKYLTTLEGKKPTFFGWVTETIVSGFVGILTAMVCQYCKLDFLITSAITGIAAHNGTKSLYMLSNIIKKNSGISIELSGRQEQSARSYKKED